MYLSDLVFIEDGNKNFKNGLINFKKKILLSKIILQIRSLQQNKYSFRVVNDLYFYFLNFPNIINDEDVLYDMSLLIEPRDDQFNV
jgi:S-adenosylmethionine:diacylglycerol 3-amino-3-carboxypropyl transferase